MEKYMQKAQILIEALPYIREFNRKTIVVKCGGSAMGDKRVNRTIAQDIALMKFVGMNPVIVHGGGPEINQTLKRMGIESEFQEGLRVTDEETVGIVEMVLSGRINKAIVNLINEAGGRAVGVSGKDGALIHAHKKCMDSPQAKSVDLGYVGQVDRIDPTLLDVLDNGGCIPVIAPLGTDSEGNTWNINADSVAGAVAASLKAEKLVLMTDTPGILRDKDNPETLIHGLSREQLDKLRAEGTIAGGMLPKVEACETALNGGVAKTHIIDGRIEHALLLEVLTDAGIGTVITP